MREPIVPALRIRLHRAAGWRARADEHDAHQAAPIPAAPCRVATRGRIMSRNPRPPVLRARARPVVSIRSAPVPRCVPRPRSPL